jgi:hypothetical protein
MTIISAPYEAGGSSMPNEACAPHFADVYRAMAVTLDYRPDAPSGAFGTDMPTRELVIEQEIDAYARRMWALEDTGRYVLVGCPNFAMRKTMLFALEAVDACFGGDEANHRVGALLALAAAVNPR